MSCLAAVHSGWNSQQQHKTWGTPSPVLSHPPCYFSLVLSIKSPLTFSPIFFFKLVIILIWQSRQRKCGYSNTLTALCMLEKIKYSAVHVDVYRHFFFSWVTHKCLKMYPSLSVDPFCCGLTWFYIHPWVHTSNWIYFETIAWQNKIRIYSELSLLRMNLVITYEIVINQVLKWWC